MNSHLPSYLVASASMPSPSKKARGYHFKIVDFGSSHPIGDRPQIKCPLVLRPLEALLDNEWSTEADVWSLGCMVYIHCQFWPEIVESILRDRPDTRIYRWTSALRYDYGR